MISQDARAQLHALLADDLGETTEGFEKNSAHPSVALQGLGSDHLGVGQDELRPVLGWNDNGISSARNILKMAQVKVSVVVALLEATKHLSAESRARLQAVVSSGERELLPFFTKAAFANQRVKKLLTGALCDVEALDSLVHDEFGQEDVETLLAEIVAENLSLIKSSVGKGTLAALQPYLT